MTTLVSSVKCFGGRQNRYKHTSATVGTEMHFSVFVPSSVSIGPVNVIYWLSGLTCTDENFVIKAGGQRAAEKNGVMVVCPDTSPRGANIEGEGKSWDFGLGAGFYVNATQEPWSKNYNMFDYVTIELPSIISSLFTVNRQSIMGHSMGGHGALICALKSRKYQSVSAFAPIANPTECAWGKKAFGGYLGSDTTVWTNWDATLLVAQPGATDNLTLPILIDQGSADQFLADGQLRPDAFVAACERANFKVNLRMQDGYDHGYFFIATFIEEHIAFHAQAMQSK